MTPPLPVPPPIEAETTLTPHQWGMLAFLLSEVALFSTLITTFLNYRGIDVPGPNSSVLSLPLVVCTTACLVYSSVTIHQADQELHTGSLENFMHYWGRTIILGVVFLLGTAYEWRELIVHHGLKISTNLFGTTYYTLVGFHAFHVTLGVLMMIGVYTLMHSKAMDPKDHTVPQLVSWYWHFVDVVWLVVFTIVYIF
jgi:cytochrome c oxidase subunit 3